ESAGIRLGRGSGFGAARSAAGGTDPGAAAGRTAAPRRGGPCHGRPVFRGRREHARRGGAEANAERSPRAGVPADNGGGSAAGGSGGPESRDGAGPETPDGLE